MNPRLIDPNNHVPDISPDDGWGDADGLSTSLYATGVALPPRRVAATASTSRSEIADRVGLRIDTQVARAEPTRGARRLEVQEITGSVPRLESAAPAPPKVPHQVTFHERPPSVEPVEKATGEGRQWGVTHGLPRARWMIAAVAGIGAVVVTGMLLLPWINAPNAARPLSAEFAPVLEENIVGMEALNFLINKQPEALRIYQSYITAGDVDDLLPLIRDGTAMAGVIRKRWHPAGISRQWSPDPSSHWSVIMLAGRACAVLEGNLPDHSEFRAVFTYDHSRLLLDWMATTGYGTATFRELVAGTGDPAEIRGQIGPADFYSAIFPEADYRSFRLIPPTGDEYLWCYTRRGTPEDDALAPLFEKGIIVDEAATALRVTVRLARGPEGSQPDQWLVTGMLHEDWARP